MRAAPTSREACAPHSLVSPLLHHRRSRRSALCSGYAETEDSRSRSASLLPRPSSFAIVPRLTRCALQDGGGAGAPYSGLRYVESEAERLRLVTRTFGFGFCNVPSVRLPASSTVSGARVGRRRTGPMNLSIHRKLCLPCRRPTQRTRIEEVVWSSRLRVGSAGGPCVGALLWLCSTFLPSLSLFSVFVRGLELRVEDDLCVVSGGGALAAFGSCGVLLLS